MRQTIQISSLNNQGFTLIEVIAVLVIIGILSVVALSKMNDKNTDFYAIESSLKAHLRYAQSKAMYSESTVWGLRMNSGNDVYWLFNSNLNTACAWGANRILPPGGSASDALGTLNRIQTRRVGVDISGILIGTASTTRLTLVFNQMGVPFTAERETLTFLEPLNLTNNLTRLTADIKINLSDGSGNSRTITISHETGFVK